MYPGKSTHARKLWIGLAVLGGLLLGIPQASAHGFGASGIATKNGETFRIFISRSADLANGSDPYAIRITDFQLNVIEDESFLASDNFVDDDDLPSPAFVNPDFHAQSTTSGICFEMDGVQVNVAIEGSGHFQGYEFTVATSFIA